MIQNHLLQVLCVIAMEPPSTFDADSVRIEKLKVLKAFRPYSIGQVDQYAVRGQYGPGNDGANSAYRSEDGVAPDTRTETFAAMEFTVENWRWQGVPLYLRTGKRMAQRATYITLQFRQPPHLIFEGEAVQCSTLTIRVQPEEGISLSFSGKIPGPDVRLGTVKMDFDYASSFGGRSPEAYETLLLDCFLGDGTLYANSEWIEKSWELKMPVLEAWNVTTSGKISEYPAGSWGPQEADALMKEEWRSWVNL